MNYDVFNGDADGIFALHQFRLCYPCKKSEVVTGVKRDIRLLDKLKDVQDATITVFDVSLDSNRKGLARLLLENNEIRYFDHHFAGEIPKDARLRSHIDLSADICTSLIVNRELNQPSPAWAICGAYGDNLHKPAQTLATALSLTAKETAKLKELGELFNYNGYGADLSDLHFHPTALYRAIAPYSSPFTFIEESEELKTLRQGYFDDLAKADNVEQLPGGKKNRIFLFPDAPWSRRISGVYSNMKAREKKDAAHAVLSINGDGSYRVSVRAPLTEKRDADTLCKAFATGGGRAAAAGINSLPATELDSFLQAMGRTYP